MGAPVQQQEIIQQTVEPAPASTVLELYGLHLTTDEPVLVGLVVVAAVVVLLVLGRVAIKVWAAARRNITITFGRDE